MNIHVSDESFDSGFRGEYKGYHIDKRLISSPHATSPILLKLYSFKNVPNNVIHPLSLGVEIFHSIEYLNKIINIVYLQHTNIEVINNICEINIQKENIIHIMKRIIDDIVMFLCIEKDIKYFKNHYEIRVRSFGDINKFPNLSNKIKAELNYGKYQYILNTINCLHNAYKHSCLLNQSRQEFTPNGVALFAYYVPYGNLKDIICCRHNLMHIVIGFSDFLLEFFAGIIYGREHNLIKVDKYIEIN